MERLVETVLGPIPASALGKTLMHEHFVFGYPGYQGNSLVTADRDKMIQTGIEVARRVQQYGVKTIVDATPNDMARDPEVLREISRQTGLHIICATGFYYEGEGATAYFHFKRMLGTAEAEIYEIFSKEVTEGIGQTGIKTGVIKLATSKDVMTDYEQMFFRAAARVHKETGVPILTHTQEGTMGPEQADFLINEGVDPKRILIGHMDGNTDIHYHLRTLAKGVYVGFDRLGLQGQGYVMDAQRIAVLQELLSCGYARQLVLSHDTVNYWMGKPPEMPGVLQNLLANWHPTHLFESIIPALLGGGATEAQIKTILEENPQRFFAG